MSDHSFDHFKALILEDNVHMRTLLRSMVQAVGIGQVIECADGMAAFRALRVKKPDLIFTDLAMEPIDGIAFTRMVRTAKDSPNPRIPIVMVTGHTERARVEAARDAGVTEFIVKPITLQNLSTRLVEIVERPRPFIISGTYTGPDRRRRCDRSYRGPLRREGDVLVQ